MKKLLNWGEWYPVYDLREPDQGVGNEALVDIDEALWERYKAAQIEFDAVQEILARLRPAVRS